MAIELKQVIEALLFAAPKPQTARQILQILQKGNAGAAVPVTGLEDCSEAQVGAVIEEIKKDLENAGHGFVIQEMAGGFRLGTRGETSAWVRLLYDETKPSRLSQPALETLSIIAYRQPISRADIEAVRGVAVDGVVSTLLERRVIKLAGRSDAPGRPLLYETTPEFLEIFGLRNLQELPNADELRRIPIPKASIATPPSVTTETTLDLASQLDAQPGVPSYAASNPSGELISIVASPAIEEVLPDTTPTSSEEDSTHEPAEHSS